MDTLPVYINEILQSLISNPALLLAFASGLLIAGAFGFPLPEEATIITISLVSFASDTGGKQVVSPWVLSGVCWISVVIGDVLIYNWGRLLRSGFIKIKAIRKIISDNKVSSKKSWVEQWGIFSAIMIRWTPGTRFYGPLILGYQGFRFRTYLIATALAGLVSIPSQVFLVSYFGSNIRAYIYKYQWLLPSIAIGIWILISLWTYFFQRLQKQTD